MRSTDERSGELYSSFSRVKYLFKLFLIILQGCLVNSPLFIYVFNHFISIWIYGYLFYTLGYNPIQSSSLVVQKLILCISCPVLESHFSNEPYFSLSEEDVRNQGLGTRCTCCYWGVSMYETYKPIRIFISLVEPNWWLPESKTLMDQENKPVLHLILYITIKKGGKRGLREIYWW